MIGKFGVAVDSFIAGILLTHVIEAVKVGPWWWVIIVALFFGFFASCAARGILK